VIGGSNRSATNVCFRSRGARGSRGKGGRGGFRGPTPARFTLVEGDDLHIVDSARLSKLDGKKIFFLSTAWIHIPMMSCRLVNHTERDPQHRRRGQRQVRHRPSATAYSLGLKADPGFDHRGSAWSETYTSVTASRANATKVVTSVLVEILAVSKGLVHSSEMAQHNVGTIPSGR